MKYEVKDGKFALGADHAHHRLRRRPTCCRSSRPTARADVDQQPHRRPRQPAVHRRFQAAGVGRRTQAQRASFEVALIRLTTRLVRAEACLATRIGGKTALAMAELASAEPCFARQPSNTARPGQARPWPGGRCAVFAGSQTLLRRGKPCGGNGSATSHPNPSPARHEGRGGAGKPLLYHPHLASVETLTIVSFRVEASISN